MFVLQGSVAAHAAMGAVRSVMGGSDSAPAAAAAAPAAQQPQYSSPYGNAPMQSVRSLLVLWLWCRTCRC